MGIVAHGYTEHPVQRVLDPPKSPEPGCGGIRTDIFIQQENARTGRGVVKRGGDDSHGLLLEMTGADFSSLSPAISRNAAGMSIRMA